MSVRRSDETVEFGDFQTPRSLARQCCAVIGREIAPPATVVEPTCGEGEFAFAASEAFDDAKLFAYEINPSYVRSSKHRLGRRATVIEQDFFSCDWKAVRSGMEGPVLFLGNPPWVTNSQLGILASGNLPRKTNAERVRGIDAMTGRSNFDLSESILRTLLQIMQPDDTLAMLVKTATARKVLKFAWSKAILLTDVSLRSVNSRRYFGVHVGACLMMLRRCDAADRSSERASHSKDQTQVCLWSDGLSQPADKIAMGWFRGKLVPNPEEAAATAHLQSDGSAEQLRWRSGVKHDASGVLELKQEGQFLVNRQGEVVDVEADRVYPLAKGADVSNQRADCLERRILLPQIDVKDNTSLLDRSHPKMMAYLESNEAAFSRRKSSIYRSRDRFALFGIGGYTFASWKVAICGLYKHLSFAVFGPVHRRPVIFDDTSYFLSLQSEAQAKLVRRLLHSEPARRFLEARIFWDAKRPITAEVLRQLDLAAVARELKLDHEFQRLLNGICPSNEILTG